DLTLNTSWTSNPFVWPAEPTTPSNVRGLSGYEGSSNIWDLSYHTYSQDILVGFLAECYTCRYAGNQRAEGRIYRVDADYGTVSGNYGDMGPVNAFDLRVGVVET